MRLKYLLLPFLTLSFLSGCGQEEELVIIDIDPSEEISKGQSGGDLIDIALDYYLEPNSKYVCTFVPSNISDTTIRVVSSRPYSATIDCKPGSNLFTICTQKPGDSLITIYDANNIIKYNKVIHVRKAYNEVDVLDAVCKNDIYTSTGIYGSYRFSYDKVTGVISGTDKDTADSSKFVFTLEYNSIADGDLFESHFYIFDTIMDDELSTHDYDIAYLYISKCADRLFAYDFNGDLFEIFSLSK